MGPEKEGRRKRSMQEAPWGQEIQLFLFQRNRDFIVLCFCYRGTEWSAGAGGWAGRTPAALVCPSGGIPISRLPFRLSHALCLCPSDQFKITHSCSPKEEKKCNCTWNWSLETGVPIEVLVNVLTIIILSLVFFKFWYIREKNKVFTSKDINFFHVRKIGWHEWWKKVWLFEVNTMALVSVRLKIKALTHTKPSKNV